MGILETLERDLRIDAFCGEPPHDVIGASRFRCSIYGNNQGGHIFVYYIRASDPNGTRPEKCVVCGNPDVDAYEG